MSENDKAKRDQRYAELNAEIAHNYNTELQMSQQRFNASEAEKARQWSSEKERVKRLRQAGLSVGLMYSGSGGGSGGSASVASSGAIGQSPTGVAGRSDTSAGMMAGIGSVLNQGVGAVSQARKNQSEIELNKALASKANADAKKTEGVDTQKAEAEIGEITSKIGLIGEQAKTEVVRRQSIVLENQMADMEVKFQEATFENKVSIMKEQNSQMVRQSGILMEDLAEKRRRNEIGEKTMKAEIGLAVQEYHNAVTAGVVMGTQAYLNEKHAELTIEEKNEVMRKITAIGEDQEIKRDAIQAMRRGQTMGMIGTLGAATIGAAGQILGGKTKALKAVAGAAGIPGIGAIKNIKGFNLGEYEDYMNAMFD